MIPARNATLAEPFRSMLNGYSPHVPALRRFRVTGTLPDGQRLEYVGAFSDGSTAINWAIDQGANGVIARSLGVTQ